MSFTVELFAIILNRLYLNICLVMKVDIVYSARFLCIVSVGLYLEQFYITHVFDGAYPLYYSLSLRNKTKVRKPYFYVEMFDKTISSIYDSIGRWYVLGTYLGKNIYTLVMGFCFFYIIYLVDRRTVNKLKLKIIETVATFRNF